MALVIDQQQQQPQSNFKYYCKFCKKGFGCGRALGGHMRVHGIGDENGHLDDEDHASDWEYKLEGGGDPPKNKRMYALRTNPNRLKTCRVCENCGKEFLSWKSFLEHGKCSSEDAESLVSSPGSDGEDYVMDEEGTGTRGGGGGGCGNWSKRKRSFRAKVGDYNNPNCPSSEEEDLANCLMMLSNATVDPLIAEPEESCASASKEEERRNSMNFISPLAYRTTTLDTPTTKAAAIPTKGLFECKACKKVFNSHQALGGHRASHKKVKGCFAARLDQAGLDDSMADDDVITHEEFFPTKSNSTLHFDHGSNAPLPSSSSSKRKSKVHECSICHRVFSSGQALGGHKRCHWITSNSPEAASSLAKFHHFQEHIEQIQQRPTKFLNNSDTLDLTLDLNLPAPPIVTTTDNDNAAARREHRPSFEVSTEIYLKSWVGVDVKQNDDHNHHHQNQSHQNEEDNVRSAKRDCDGSIQNNNNNNNNNNIIITTNNNNNVEDEADSKVKLAKLSELKDMGMNGSSSPWLQVGIGSTTDVGADP